MEPNQFHKKDLLYPELSYSIVGCAFDVFKELGAGRLEKYYQAGMKIKFEEKKIAFKEQVFFEVKMSEKIVGKVFLDFIIDEKVIVEIKKDDRFSISHINQVNNYLKTTQLKLALLINFGKNDVKFKRLVNLY